MDVKAFFKLSYGMYIVSSINEDKYNGQIANTVVQITADPAQLLISINKDNLTREYIDASKKFTVSVLSEETPIEFIGKFGFKSGRDINKFEGTEYKTGETGAPIVLENSLSYFECEVLNRIESETHILYIGRVIELEVIKEGNPMTYAYYHKVKGGMTQKNAPTYIKKEKNEGGSKMEQYRCTVCGYIYDPEKGDPDSGIAPGTKFEDIPDDWVCPICGVDKSSFEKV